MEYNQDEMTLGHNTFGDRFEIWYRGDRLVTVDLDGDDPLLTHSMTISTTEAFDLLVQALADKVLKLESALERSKNE